MPFSPPSGNPLAVVLCSEERLAETLTEKSAIGKVGKLIVMREMVDLVRAAAMFGDIAGGNGDSIANRTTWTFNQEPLIMWSSMKTSQV